MSQTKSTSDLMMDAVIQMRGSVLQLAVQLEMVIDVYIAEHFTKDVNLINEFICLILSPSVNLKEKLRVFVFLVNKYDPEFKQANPKFAKDLDSIIEQRNAFAHLPIDVSETAIQSYRQDAQLQLIRFKNFSESGETHFAKSFIYTEKAINNLIQYMHYYYNELLKLIGTASAPQS